MDLLDINILITAFRPDTEYHKTTKSWLEDNLSDGHQIRLFSMVEAGFLRIVTHAKFYQNPSPLAEALRFLEALTKAPTVEIADWRPSTRQLWGKLCTQLKLSGNDCNDAMLAAIAIERGWRLVSFNRGFTRFPKLRYWNPAESN